MLDEHMKIGEVAQRCEGSTDTLRYYEERGLVAEPPRFESSGYRAYPPETVERVQFIQSAQELGFTLAEIQELLELRATDEASCAQVRELAQTKIEKVRTQIDTLRRVLRGLEDLTQICPGDIPADRCPIIEVLRFEKK
jgi:MerR family mercuric resistance operon transcriptional regulator